MTPVYVCKKCGQPCETKLMQGEDFIDYRISLCCRVTADPMRESDLPDPSVVREAVEELLRMKGDK